MQRQRLLVPFGEESDAATHRLGASGESPAHRALGEDAWWNWRLRRELKVKKKPFCQKSRVGGRKMRGGGSLTEQASRTKTATRGCLTCAIGAASSVGPAARGRRVSQRSLRYAVVTNNLSDNGGVCSSRVLRWLQSPCWPRQP